MLSKGEELRYRIVAKQNQLQARLAQLSADAGAEAGQERDVIADKLLQIKNELEQDLEKLTDQAAAKINQWLKD